jgi:hypothetical protein
MYFDIAMPLTVFTVTLVSMFLNEKVEAKLKTILEERKFTLRDTVMLVMAMGVMISLIVFVPQFAIIIVFLFSYSMLLFIFTYVFSNGRWYIAIMPPAIFILLYFFLHDAPIWSEYLVNIYAVIFAILISLYLGSLFTWKTTLFFSMALTVLDIILVLVTGTMVSAATTTVSLNLPVVVTLPIIPALNGKMLLGLGDFFFAGLLAMQTSKEVGKNFAILTVATMAISFFIFESLLLTYRPGPFPGTVMILCGWLPLIAFKKLKKMTTS